jgi:predicted RNA-binding Zn ribbon-like protein
MLQLKEKPIARIKLIGGRHCLDFVNTIGGRKDSGTKGMDTCVIRDEKLNEYSDLLAWGLRIGVLSDLQAQRLLQESLRNPAGANVVFKRAIALREAIYRISKAILHDKHIKDTDLEILNRELLIAHSRRMLAAATKGFQWEWNHQDRALDRVLWSIADSAAEMLTTADLSRLRQCPGEDCGWLFDDTSRNRSRQWCDMKDCGNIAKVRRFRARTD